MRRHIAVVFVGLFYVFTAWCLASAAGADRVSAVTKSDPGASSSNRSLEHLGAWGADAVSVLVLAARSRQGPRALQQLGALSVRAEARRVCCRARWDTPIRSIALPHIAGWVLTVALLIVLMLSALAGLDPLTNVATALVGLGSVGLMALLAVTSTDHTGVLRTTRHVRSRRYRVAPGVGGLVIAAATVLRSSTIRY